MDLSVVILTKNEESNIVRCLGALSWCDDVVVIDDNSSDNTTTIAIKHGARVLNNTFESFAQQRNWALDHADLKHKWVLMLDADEVATETFRNRLCTALDSAPAHVAGYMLCRKTMFLGRWLKYSDGFPVWITRVLRIGVARFRDQGHGEKAIADAGFTFERITEPFLHYPFSKGVSDWVARHNRYSSLEATVDCEACQNAPAGLSNLLRRDPFARRQALLDISRNLPGRPILRFLYQYFIKRGVLEGRAGLTFCWLMAVYEGLIVLKRREYQLAKKGVPL